MPCKKRRADSAVSCGNGGHCGSGAASSSERGVSICSPCTARSRTPSREGLPSGTSWPRALWPCRGLAGHVREPAGRCLTGRVLWQALILHQISSSGCFHSCYFSLPFFFFFSCVGWPKPSDNREAQSRVACPPWGAGVASGQHVPSGPSRPCFPSGAISTSAERVGFTLP